MKELLNPEGFTYPTMEESIERACEIYNEFDLDVSDCDVEKMFERSIKAKERVSKFFGLTEEKGYRKYMEMEVDNTLSSYAYDYLYPIVKFCLNLSLQNKDEQFDASYINMDDAIRNKVSYKGQQLKISKLIQKYSEEVSNQHGYSKKSLMSEYRVDDFNKLFNVMFAPKRKNTFLISTNPLDILCATYNASFSSCYRITGEYFGATASILIDDFTLFTGMVSPNPNDIVDNRISRAWLFNHFEEKCFLQGRRYNESAYSRVIEEKFGDWVRDLYTEAFNLDYDDWDTYKPEYNEDRSKFQSVNDFLSHGYTHVYADTDVSYHTTNGGYSPEDRLEFPEGICLDCGCHGVVQRDHKCASCTNFGICSSCDGDISGDEYRSPDGEVMCESCFYDQYFYCDDCGELHAYDNGYIADDYSRYCSYCSEDRFVCDHCGEIHHVDDHVEPADSEYYNYCRNCADNQLYKCDDCGAYYKHKDFYSVDNGDSEVCSDCRDSYTECNDCGDLFSSTTTDPKGNEVCYDCYDQNYAECEECGFEFAIEDMTGNLCDECARELEDEEDEEESSTMTWRESA